MYLIISRQSMKTYSIVTIGIYIMNFNILPSMFMWLLYYEFEQLLINEGFENFVEPIGIMIEKAEKVILIK